MALKASSAVPESNGPRSPAKPTTPASGVPQQSVTRVGGRGCRPTFRAPPRRPAEVIATARTKAEGFAVVVSAADEPLVVLARRAPQGQNQRQADEQPLG